VREWCEEPSNFRSEYTIDESLKKNNIIGIYDIDTRALTKKIREHGVMNGAITTELPENMDAFLKESAKVMNKPVLTLSRGAWERIATHDWPGNVRELKHCLMRAVAMADSDVIHVEDLRFDAQNQGAVRNPSSGFRIPDAARKDSSEIAQAQEPSAELSERQRIGIAYLREHGSMSRSQYQTIVGRNVPPRTAQYDLRDLVERGLLQVKGKGPATRYVLVSDGVQDW